MKIFKGTFELSDAQQMVAKVGWKNKPGEFTQVYFVGYLEADGTVNFAPKKREVRPCLVQSIEGGIGRFFKIYPHEVYIRETERPGGNTRTYFTLHMGRKVEGLRESF